MSDLLFCPFCGGEAETLTAESMYGGYLFGIMCNDCRSRGDVYDTEAEAIAAWNSRADYHGYEQAAIEAWESIKAWNSRAEHICHNLDKHHNIMFKCSECGHWECQDLDGEKILPQKWNYCPNCGAKVVN